MGVRFDSHSQVARLRTMNIFRRILLLVTVSTLLSSCGAPIVQNTLALPGSLIRGAAQTVGLGGVAGL